jgi:hypothetical protein
MVKGGSGSTFLIDGERKGGGRSCAAPRGEREWGRAPAGNHDGGRLASARDRWARAAQPFKTREGEQLIDGATWHSAGLRGQTPFESIQMVRFEFKQISNPFKL